jgi:hypothetical protein
MPVVSPGSKLHASWSRLLICSARINFFKALGSDCPACQWPISQNMLSVRGKITMLAGFIGGNKTLEGAIKMAQCGLSLP